MDRKEVIAEAQHFLENEKQFHLGFLPTEQSNPKTRNLDQKFAKSTAEGIKNLQTIDRDVALAAAGIFASDEFARMVEVGTRALINGGKIIFSGCGATGRLSILLEAMWLKWFVNCECEFSALAPYKYRIKSIMTGGDYALIRSVENYEDYNVFGRQQVREIEIEANDVLIAISEGGETSSVLGTIDEALDRGADVFFLFNNPCEILAQHLKRSRLAINDHRVTVIELYSGPMAVAGSTRMQATTFEMLVAGAALEDILSQLIAATGTMTEKKEQQLARHIDYVEAFGRLLDDLEASAAVEAMSTYTDFEADIYRNCGRITYFADNYLLDILTDTTERAPTFSLPPFRKCDDAVAPPSWAFVKNPFLSTPATWETTLGRLPRCLKWHNNDYRALGADERICANPPKLDTEELYKFIIGNEPDASRVEAKPNSAVMVAAFAELADGPRGRFENAFMAGSKTFASQMRLLIGAADNDSAMAIPVSPVKTRLELFEHLAVKLVLNTISTATMVKLGRISGNWMSWVELTNKKLVDRSIRLISELGGVSYEEACHALFAALAERDKYAATISPVQYTLAKLKRIHIST